jgi:hypothetical protein
MKQTADRLFFGELVVQLRGLGRGQDVRFDLNIHPT